MISVLGEASLVEDCLALNSLLMALTEVHSFFIEDGGKACDGRDVNRNRPRDGWPRRATAGEVQAPPGQRAVACMTGCPQRELLSSLHAPRTQP